MGPCQISRGAGKCGAPPVHELLGAVGDDIPDLERARRYEQALEAYLARDFAGAIERLVEGCEGDAASDVLRARCPELRANPSPEDWTGVRGETIPCDTGATSVENAEMRTRGHLAALLIVASAVVVGCGKSPEKLCAMINDVNEANPVDDCVSKLAALKQSTSPGYDCAVGCAGLNDAKSMGNCFSICGKVHPEVLVLMTREQAPTNPDEKSNDVDEADGPNDKADEPLAHAVDRWLAAPNKDIEYQDTESKMKYGVTLVKGMNVVGDGMWGDDVDPLAPEVWITFSEGAPRKVVDAWLADDAKSGAASTVVKKEVTDSDYVLHFESDKGIRVLRGFGAAGKVLQCSARVSAPDLPKKDALFAWLEKICRSAKLK